MTIKWDSLLELGGHATSHLAGQPVQEESSTPTGAIVWDKAEPVTPKSSFGTFLSSAVDEATRSMPARNFYDIIRAHHALSQMQSGNFQDASNIASKQGQQAISEREHPTASGLGRFAGAIPAFMVGGEAAKPLQSIPWMVRLAQSGRIGKGLVQAAQLAGQFGATEAIQGRPSAIPSGLAQGAMLGGFLGATQPSATLSGRTVEEAKGALESKRKALVTQADVETRKYRRPTETVSGGQLEVPAREALAREAEFAWEPVRTLAKSIPEPITYGELVDAGRRRFSSPEDEVRLQNATNLISRGYKVGRGGKATPFATQKSAEELVNLSSQYGGKIPQTIRGRKVPAKVNTLDEIDARSIISDVLYEKAPDYLKNSFQEGKERWQDYAVSFRDPMHKYLQVGTSAAQETKPGIDLFTRVANHQETPTEGRFLQKLEKELGIKIFEPLQQAGEGLKLAEKQVAKAQAAQQFARYLARASVISPLLYLFTRRPIYKALRSR